MKRRSGQLRGAAIGAGYFSQFHYDAWSRIEEVDLVAVCDLDEERAARVARTYGIPRVYTSVPEMLEAERPDFVDIITRPDSHLPLVQEAAGRGIDVICQKPLAPSGDESQELVAAAARAGVRLMVHENFRFQPWHREIRTLIERGAVGERLHSIGARTRTGDGWQPDAYLARQPYFVTMPRLLIFETGVHFIDTFRFLAGARGGEIDGVFASLRKLNSRIAGEDEGLVCFEFTSGARGVWDANRYNEPDCDDPRYTFGEFLIEGSGGSIRLFPDGRLRVQPLGEPPRDHPYHHEHRNFGSDCVYHTQRHFVHALLGGTPFETSGEDYLINLRVQEAIYQSSESGLPVRGLACTHGGAHFRESTQESRHANH